MSLRRLAGRKVGIWGLGIEGAETVRLLGDDARLFAIIDDRSDSDEVRARAAELGIEAIGIDEIADLGIDEVVRSPGISRYRDDAQSLGAAGVVHRSLTAHWIEDQDPERVVIVTGTKGKSTTSSLIAALLTAAGRPAAHVGNVGTPPTAVADVDIAVLELSSYQAGDFLMSPRLGVLTNLGHDHVDWHDGLDNYHRDKLQALSQPGIAEVVVGPAVDLTHPAIVAAFGPKSSGQPRLIEVDTETVLARYRLDTADDLPLQLRLPHFRDDVAMAITASERLAKLDPDIVRAAVRDHRWLDHRLREIAVIDGVAFVDDALGSNPTAAVAGLESLSSIVDGRIRAIVGGRDRGVDLGGYLDYLRRADNVDVFAMSETGRVVRDYLRANGRDDVAYFDLFDDAVRAAAAAARPGDVVLFGPAAATPDHEGTYRDRARRFAELVDGLRPD